MKIGPAQKTDQHFNYQFANPPVVLSKHTTKMHLRSHAPYAPISLLNQSYPWHSESNNNGKCSSIQGKDGPTDLLTYGPTDWPTDHTNERRTYEPRGHLHRHGWTDGGAWGTELDEATRLELERSGRESVPSSGWSSKRSSLLLLGARRANVLPPFFFSTWRRDGWRDKRRRRWELVQSRPTGDFWSREKEGLKRYDKWMTNERQMRKVKW